MECHRLNRDDLAAPIMMAYRARTDDECFPHLEAFYRTLHATARAASMLAACSHSGASVDKYRLSEVQSYLDQADRDGRIFA